jgi:hypothetical protein
MNKMVLKIFLKPPLFTISECDARDFDFFDSRTPHPVLRLSMDLGKKQKRMKERFSEEEASREESRSTPRSQEARSKNKQLLHIK